MLTCHSPPPPVENLATPTDPEMYFVDIALGWVSWDQDVTQFRAVHSATKNPYGLMYCMRYYNQTPCLSALST